MAFVEAGSAANYVDLLDKLVTFVTANGWALKARTQEALSATVAVGGSGYSVSDQLPLIGGNGVDVIAVFNVDSEAAGVVTAVSLVTAGAYDYIPTDPVSTTDPGGGATGCTLNVTFQPLTGTATPSTIILEGEGSGATDEIFVSIVAEDFGGGVLDWALRGHVGFQDDVDVTLQPNTSPLVHVPLTNASITYWFYATGQRIIGVFRMGSTYTNMYMGFMNRFGTAVQYPYPLAIFGCATSPNLFSDSVAGMGGLSDPISNSSSILGGAPAYIIDPGGTWRQVKNAGGAAGTRPKFHNLVVAPAGLPTTTGTFRPDTFFQPSQGTPATVAGQIPDSGAATGFRFPLFPSIVIESTPVAQVLGELDNVFWAGTLSELSGQAVSEDVYNDGVDDYTLFQNVNRTDHWTVSLIKREEYGLLVNHLGQHGRFRDATGHVPGCEWVDAG